MMQITEDTPPDMLAGAMDLTVHLPTETTVKMSVDRSTPMMDLLVQITTAHHLQQSGHILQALEMAPSSGRLDKILPYKPNTPIGVLDTQYVKVIPKNRSIPIPKSVSGGHQPFESTFRLQVHLPRNQLYVIRVSQNVYLEDIMNKVCHEKNLDSAKYEFRHPANLDEVLNPKLTLSDYQITEVYVVLKGTAGLTQTFSANDIMALRKEEERKQAHVRTGGGVFSLIFRRGKQSMGSGSISSENRSISPSHSDDSRSVTPPAIQQPLLTSRMQSGPPPKEKPKAPQRKRRPAPKPPQTAEPIKDCNDTPPVEETTNVSEPTTTDTTKKQDSGLIICHSRNSSDSSGYHESSVLSDNCNTSLPRKSKSTLINEVLNEETQFEDNGSIRSQNLTTMSNFSKSTSSITSRKKKTAPPPPSSLLKLEPISSNPENASAAVSSSTVSERADIVETESSVTDATPAIVEAKSLDDNPVEVTKTSPVPMRRKKFARAPPKPAARVKSLNVDMPIPQALNASIPKEDSIQLNTEENCNAPNEAFSINTNKCIINDQNTVTNLSSNMDNLQLADNSETTILEEMKFDDEILKYTPLSSILANDVSLDSIEVKEVINLEEKSLSNTDNKDCFDLENHSLINNIKNSTTVILTEENVNNEKQVPNVSDFESAELEILELLKNLEDLSATSNSLTKTEIQLDQNSRRSSKEIYNVEHDSVIEGCDFALKELESLGINLKDTNQNSDANNDLLNSKNSVISDCNSNNIPVPKKRLRLKSHKKLVDPVTTSIINKEVPVAMLEENPPFENLVSSCNNNVKKILENVSAITSSKNCTNNELIDIIANEKELCEDVNLSKAAFKSNNQSNEKRESLSLINFEEDYSTLNHSQSSKVNDIQITENFLVGNDNNDKNYQLEKAVLEVNKSHEKIETGEMESSKNNFASCDSVNSFLNKEIISSCISKEDCSSISSNEDLLEKNVNAMPIKYSNSLSIDNLKINALESSNLRYCVAENNNSSVLRHSKNSVSSIEDIDDFNMDTITESTNLKHCIPKNSKYLDNFHMDNEEERTFSNSRNKTSFTKNIGEEEEANIGHRASMENHNIDHNLCDGKWNVEDFSEAESADIPHRTVNSSNKSVDLKKRLSVISTTSLKSLNSEIEKTSESINDNSNCEVDCNNAIIPKNITNSESQIPTNNLNRNSSTVNSTVNNFSMKVLEDPIVSINGSRNSISSCTLPTTSCTEDVGSKPEVITKTDVMELDDLDHEWQYQLPSPPKAFRDSSPTNLTDLTNYDTITLQDFKDNSILSHPELFEKLKNIKDSQYESESISDYSSVCNDEDKPILSKLTLENLEKRQSLVYNRELSTSLKNAQENNFPSQINKSRSVDDTNIKRFSVVNELEKVIKNNKPLTRHNSCIADTTLKPFVDNTLPNFKISTYDTFKRKINIFEDESIRSNSDNCFKATTYDDNSKSMPYESVNNFSSKSPLKSQSLSIAKSVENLSNMNVDSDQVDFKKPPDYSKHNSHSKNSFYIKHKSSTLNNAGRSESFSANKWMPQNPVQRSKSQVALNKFTEFEQDIKYHDNLTPLTKSNSLFDVSGLQSLEVIRSIQNKLNTPNNSTEDLLGRKEDYKESSTRSSVSLDQESTEPVLKSESETATTKTYRYQGPPSINLSTWSERPKTKVSLKEDTDYKIKNLENCKSNNNASVTFTEKPTDSIHKNTVKPSSLAVQVNGADHIRKNQDLSQSTIKVGSNQFSKQFQKINKLVQNMENFAIRKPLGNVNKIDEKQRPHSVCLDSDFDISRVPVVRAVELKKSIKEPSSNNTSITQINALNTEITNSNKYIDIYQSSDRLQEINSLKNQPHVQLKSENTHKPVTRGNSFAFSRNLPKVMGFTDINIENDNTPRSRKSWNVPNNYEPLPLKIKPEPPVRSSSFLPNSNVPFSNLTLKRVESKNADVALNNNIYGNIVLRNSSSHSRNDHNINKSTRNEITHQDTRRISNGTNTVPPCPPLKPIASQKFVKRAESCVDSRDELLNSIRNFGGTKALRHVKAV